MRAYHFHFLGLWVFQHYETIWHVVVNAFLTLTVVTLGCCIHDLELHCLVRLLHQHEVAGSRVFVSVEHVLEVLEGDEISALSVIDELIAIVVVIIEGQFVWVWVAILKERNSLVKRETDMAATMVLEFI